MRTSLKRKLSAFLAFTIILSALFTCSLSASAAEEAALDNAVLAARQVLAGSQGEANPIIVVPGIGMSDVALFDDEGNEIENEGTFKNRWRVLNLCTDEILGDIWKLVPKLLLSIALQRDIGLSDIVRDYMPGMFKYTSHDLQGKSIENVKAIERNYPLSMYDEDARADFFNMMPMQNYMDLIGEDKIYCFNFPPFCNTYDQAARLNDFIQTVKQQTGCDKVNLVPLSLGATITNAYFDEYADNHDIEKVVRIVGASDGSLVFADLVSQNYASNSAELFYKDMWPQLMNGYMGYLINIACRILPKKVFNNILDAAFDVIRNDFFVNTPSMWSIVPAERYEELADIYLADTDHAYLRTLTDKYYAYQSNLKANIGGLVADGVDIYNICGYGFNIGHGWGDYQYFQFFACAENVNTDGVIQVSSTGMGTYSCAPGEQFPADYVQQNTVCKVPGHNHISPDRMIDASTSYLPERTWYFSGQHHESAYNDVIVSLACLLMATDTINDVHTDPRFPQFNGSRNVKRIIRDYLPKAEEALLRTDLADDVRAQLQSAVDEAKAMLASTVADDARCDAVEAALFDALVAAGVYQAPAKPSLFNTILEKSLKFTSDKLWEQFGPRGFSEML